jgi:hypothetical protein
VDGDGRRGLVIGARILSNGSTTAGQPSLVLTRISPTATLTAAASGVVAGPALADNLFLVDSPFAYLGQPYTVAPDGRVIQPVADESGYSLMVYTFERTVEVNP